MPRMPLGLALIGMSGVGAPTSLREQVEHARQLGFRGVALNAAAAGARPRDLSRSARRDLAALLRRCELVCAGVDLFIPPDHYSDEARVDRAASATVDAIDFAAEIAALAGGRAVVCVTLPTGDAAASSSAMVESLADHARSVGVLLADCSWPIATRDEPDAAHGPSLGIDPAALILAGNDPASELLRLGAAVACTRLSDIDTTGRVTPGDGRLDLLGYTVALSMRPDLTPVVFDPRGLPRPHESARRVIERCGLAAQQRIR